MTSRAPLRTTVTWPSWVARATVWATSSVTSAGTCQCTHVVKQVAEVHVNEINIVRNPYQAFVQALELDLVWGECRQCISFHQLRSLSDQEQAVLHAELCFVRLGAMALCMHRTLQHTASTTSGRLISLAFSITMAMVSIIAGSRPRPGPTAATGGTWRKQGHHRLPVSFAHTNEHMQTGQPFTDRLICLLR